MRLPTFIRHARRGPTVEMLPVALALVLAVWPMTAYAQGAGPDSVALVWTAPGDDGDAGTAGVYEMRVSTSNIDAGNWASAGLVTGLPASLTQGVDSGPAQYHQPQLHQPVNGSKAGPPSFAANRSSASRFSRILRGWPR